MFRITSYLPLFLIGVFAFNLCLAGNKMVESDETIKDVLSKVVKKYNSNLKVKNVLNELDQHFFSSREREYFKEYLKTNKIKELQPIELNGKILSFKEKGKAVANLEAVSLFPTQYRLNDYPLENSKMTSLKEKMAYFERVLKMRPLKAEASLNLFFEEAYAAEQGFFRGLGASMGLVTTYVDEDKPGGKQAVSFLQGLDAWEKEKFKYKSSATATTVDLQCQGDDVKLRVVTPDYLSIDHEEVIYRFPLNTGMSRAMGNIDVEFVSQDKTSTCEEIKAAKSSPCRWRTAVTTNVFNEGDYEKHFSGLLSGGGSKDLQEKYFGRILPLGVLEAAKSCCTRDLRDSTQCAAIVADNRGDKSMIAAEPAGAKTKTTGAR